MHGLIRNIAAAIVVGATTCHGLADTTAPSGLAVSEFDVKNAVIDTSVLFAAGAVEEVQELRNAFGWPTFQAGMVNGIFFRFDPDGYARFGPSPRLDADVFEVICLPRTRSCRAQKGVLSLDLGPSDRIQLGFDDLTKGERFFGSDGATELELPADVLLPLDAKLESFLASISEVVVRRGNNEVARVPLAGFAETISYLRWVAANQDYAALPGEWPVPDRTDPPLQPQTRDGEPAPMPGIADGPDAGEGAALDGVGKLPPDPEVEALRIEVENLRRQLSAEKAQSDIESSQIAEPQVAATPPNDQSIEPAAVDTGINQKPDKLLAATIADAPPFDDCDFPGNTPCMNGFLGASEKADALPSVPETTEERMARQLSFLLDDIGIDARTANLVIQLGKASGLPDPAQLETPEAVLLDSAFKMPMVALAHEEQVTPQPNGTFDGTSTAPGSAECPPIGSVAVEEEYLLLADFLAVQNAN